MGGFFCSTSDSEESSSESSDSDAELELGVGAFLGFFPSFLDFAKGQNNVRSRATQKLLLTGFTAFSTFFATTGAAAAAFLASFADLEALFSFFSFFSTTGLTTTFDFPIVSCGKVEGRKERRELGGRSINGRIWL